MTFSAALTDFRAQFHAADPEPKDDGLRQVPVTPETLPTAEQLHLARWGVEKLRRQHERERSQK